VLTWVAKYESVNEIVMWHPEIGLGALVCEGRPSCKHDGRILVATSEMRYRQVVQPKGEVISVVEVLVDHNDRSRWIARYETESSVTSKASMMLDRCADEGCLKQRSGQLGSFGDEQLDSPVNEPVYLDSIAHVAAIVKDGSASDFGGEPIDIDEAFSEYVLRN